MWYEDLTECDYFGKFYARILTSIGWLKKEKPFTVGKVSQNVYLKLCEFNKMPLNFAVFRGFHQCDLCKSKEAKGNSNIFIPHNGKIYVCPELITHYINTHQYLPPNEFIEAVLACPPICSMDYRKKMLENGFKALIKLISK
jgi:hypothetical protein